VRISIPNFGPLELVIVLLLVVMVFGVGRLPEVGGAAGRRIAGFRGSVAERNERSAEKRE
jgi:sec-independent protein translocase protein TatA